MSVIVNDSCHDIAILPTDETLTMAQTASTMLPLGTPAPAFSLPEPATGELVSPDRFRDAPALLVIFMCNHCPFVKHIRDGLIQFARDYQARGLAIIAINANDVANHPNDSPENMAEEAQSFGYSFPYLYDETQAVAKAYRAACTPDFFLFDANRKLVYRGQFDGSRPGNAIPVTGADLRAAADATLAGGTIPSDQKPSIGCNIKWKAGNEPEYYR
jgi:thiol-disulfide isomerase/thioredoxin